MSKPLTPARLKKFILHIFAKYVGWPLHKQTTWEEMSNSLARRIRNKAQIGIQVDIEVRFVRDNLNNKCITIKWAFSTPLSSYFIEETLIIR